MSNPEPGPVGPTPITSGGQFLALLARFLLGYAVLFSCVVLLLQTPAWTFSAVDVVFWCAFVLVLVLHRLASRTEAEVRHWRGIALRHIAVAAPLWLCSQSVQALP